MSFPIPPQARNLPLLVAFAGAATVLALLTTAQAGIALAHEGQFIPWSGLLKARLVDWYSCALFMPLLYWLTQRCPVDHEHWSRNLPILLLASVPIAVAKEAIFVAVGNLFRPGVFDLSTILAEDLSHEVIAVWALLGLAHALVFHERSNLRADREENVGPARHEAAIADAILVRTRRGAEWIRLADVECVEALGNYARLVTAHGRYVVRDTMARLERRLGSAFVRVHRSVIVRRDRIARVEARPNGRFWLYLPTGQRVGSGRSYREAIRALRPR